MTSNPTRDEVDTLIERLETLAGGWPGYAQDAAATMRTLAAENAALREKLEAAEAERDALALAVDVLTNEPPKQREKRMVRELTEARAQAAAAQEAAEKLERACDTLAGLRTREMYLAMIDAGQTNALDELDFARQHARALRRTPKEPAP